MTLRVLGIDPGSRVTGWGVVTHAAGQSRRVASGTLRLNATRPLPERLLRLAEGLDALLAEHRPDRLAVERIFAARNVRSALVLGHARGVILLSAARAGVPVSEYTPAEVKQAVVGGGRAPKAQVMRMVGMLLGHAAPLAEDEADALAIALTHAAFARLHDIVG